MSYYFGLIVDDLTVLCTDRTMVKYPGEVSTSDKPRYVNPFPNLAIVPAGNLLFAERVISMMMVVGEGEGGGFDIQEIFNIKKDFEKTCRLVYPAMKQDLPHENSDILFGGTSPSGKYRQFLGCVSSDTDFKLEVRNRPGSYICLKQIPEILEEVAKALEIFIKGSATRPLSEKKNFAQKLFSKIIQNVAAKDPQVSRSGDLIFLRNGGTEVFEF